MRDIKLTRAEANDFHKRLKKALGQDKIDPVKIKARVEELLNLPKGERLMCPELGVSLIVENVRIDGEGVISYRKEENTHHHIRSICPDCGYTTQCRCKTPKIDVKELCPHCKKKQENLSGSTNQLGEVPIPGKFTHKRVRDKVMKKRRKLAAEVLNLAFSLGEADETAIKHGKFRKKELEEFTHGELSKYCVEIGIAEEDNRIFRRQSSNQLIHAIIKFELGEIIAALVFDT